MLDFRTSLSGLTSSTKSRPGIESRDFPGILSHSLTNLRDSSLTKSLSNCGKGKETVIILGWVCVLVLRKGGNNWHTNIYKHFESLV